MGWFRREKESVDDTVEVIPPRKKVDPPKPLYLILREALYPYYKDSSRVDEMVTPETADRMGFEMWLSHGVVAEAAIRLNGRRRKAKLSPEARDRLEEEYGNAISYVLTYLSEKRRGKKIKYEIR